MDQPDYTLYLATDRGLLGNRDVCETVGEAIRHGVTVVQLREKDCSSGEFYELAVALRCVTRRYGIPLIINDRVDIMLASGADGVHVGPKDLPVEQVRLLAETAIVGFSVNSLDDLARAEAAGVDYIGVGPVFNTATKSDARTVLGLDGLRQIVLQATMPCVAIGGITTGKAAEVYRTGVAGVCAISALLRPVDTEAAVQAFRAAAARERPVAK